MSLLFNMKSIHWVYITLGLFIGVFQPAYTQRPDFHTQYSWGQLEYDFPSEEERQRLINTENFIPGVPAPIDVDVFYAPNSPADNKVFVTIPRFQRGIPVALGTVTDNRSKEGNPIIAPYPDWSWHLNSEQCNPDRIVSVYRIFIDECNRLWVLDTGRLINTIICPPQILTFDLLTNTLIKKYELPRSQYDDRSIFVTPIVDVRNECTDTFVYAADCQSPGIVVYDFNRGTSWKVTDKTFYPYPNYGTYRILGHHFELMDGVLGMALEPLNGRADRRLIYHAMSSPTENWVLTSHLRNESRFLTDPNSSPEIFNTYKHKRNTQSAAIAIDKHGVMYSGLMSEVELICWNVHSEEYGPKYWEVISNNKTKMQFASGMKVVTNKRKNYQELWTLTSRFQRVADGSLDSQDTNFRIMIEKIDDVLFGTRCKKPVRRTGGYGLQEPIFQS